MENNKNFNKQKLDDAIKIENIILTNIVDTDKKNEIKDAFDKLEEIINIIDKEDLLKKGNDIKEDIIVKVNDYIYILS